MHVSAPAGVPSHGQPPPPPPRDGRTTGGYESKTYTMLPYHRNQPAGMERYEIVTGTCQPTLKGYPMDRDMEVLPTKAVSQVDGREYTFEITRGGEVNCVGISPLCYPGVSNNAMFICLAARDPPPNKNYGRRGEKKPKPGKHGKQRQTQGQAVIVERNKI